MTLVIPYSEPVYLGWSSVHWNAIGMPLVHPVCIGIPLGNPASTGRNNTGKTCLKLSHTGMPMEKLWLLQPTLDHHWKDCNSPHTQAHIVKQSSTHASLKWQDGRTPSSKWTGLCKFSFYLEFTALQKIPILLFKRLITSTSLGVCRRYEHHYNFFVYVGLQFKWNQLRSHNFRHTSCIHKELYAGKWPELMASKPDPVSTLGYHWTDYTGTTLAAAITQWCPSGNLV